MRFCTKVVVWNLGVTVYMHKKFLIKFEAETQLQKKQ